MLVNRRQFDVDLEEEMRLHLELRQQDQIESGMSADDAQVAARRRFGNASASAFSAKIWASRLSSYLPSPWASAPTPPSSGW